jgi:hypothetical protein
LLVFRWKPRLGLATDSLFSEKILRSAIKNWKTQFAAPAVEHVGTMVLMV